MKTENSTEKCSFKKKKKKTTKEVFLLYQWLKFTFSIVIRNYNSGKINK